MRADSWRPSRSRRRDPSGRPAVTVGVHAVTRPRRGEELHRPAGTRRVDGALLRARRSRDRARGRTRPCRYPRGSPSPGRTVAQPARTGAGTGAEFPVRQRRDAVALTRRDAQRRHRSATCRPAQRAPRRARTRSPTARLLQRRSIPRRSGSVSRQHSRHGRSLPSWRLRRAATSRASRITLDSSAAPGPSARLGPRSARPASRQASNAERVLRDAGMPCPRLASAAEGAVELPACRVVARGARAAGFLRRASALAVSRSSLRNASSRSISRRAAR